MKQATELSLEELLRIAEGPAMRDGSPNPTKELARRLALTTEPLKKAAALTCSSLCPSTWKTEEGQPHGVECKALSETLREIRDGRKNS